MSNKKRIQRKTEQLRKRNYSKKLQFIFNIDLEPFKNAINSVKAFMQAVENIKYTNEHSRNHT